MLTEPRSQDSIIRIHVTRVVAIPARGCVRFQRRMSKIMPTEYPPPGRVAENVIDDIAAWVKAR